MVDVVNVKFKNTCKVYFFDPCGIETKPGDMVIVETARGIEIGTVVHGPRQVNEQELVSPLKKVIRLASHEDMRRDEENAGFLVSGVEACNQKIAQLGLEMKLVDSEYAFDRSKIIFYFTSNGRVDFRELVKQLSQTLKTRIELRQIGVRDEAKMKGGLGSCGREICCRGFLAEFAPVTIKMAREQGLSLNPTKISGLCGRLMCCLKYEQDMYENTNRIMPRIGTAVITPDGEGIVTDVIALLEKAKVRVQLSESNSEVRVYSAHDLTFSKVRPRAGKGLKTEQIAEGATQEKF